MMNAVQTISEVAQMYLTLGERKQQGNKRRRSRTERAPPPSFNYFDTVNDSVSLSPESERKTFAEILNATYSQRS